MKKLARNLDNDIIHMHVITIETVKHYDLRIILYWTIIPIVSDPAVEGLGYSGQPLFALLTPK